VASGFGRQRGWSKLGQRKQSSWGDEEVDVPTIARERRFDSRKPTPEEQKSFNAYELGTGSAADDQLFVDYKVWRKSETINSELLMWPESSVEDLKTELAYWRSFDVKAYRAKRAETAKAESEAVIGTGTSFGLSGK
jgi:hypothetical protein